MHADCSDAVRLSQMRFRDLFETKKRVIFNCDLDGLLAAGFLQSCLGWEILGICHCQGRPTDSLWLPEGLTDIPQDAVFVDMWWAPIDRAVIDQHMIAIDTEHAASLMKAYEKINPNLLWTRVCTPGLSSVRYRGYRWKYPFGAAHFVLAGLEACGRVVAIPPKCLADGIDCVDVLLRADDAQTSTYKYKDNAKDWWNYLVKLGGPTTRATSDRAFSRITEFQSGTTTGSDLLRRLDLQKMRIAQWLQSVAKGVRELTPDGGFGSHLIHHGWDQSAMNYVCRIANEFGWKFEVPKVKSLIRFTMAGSRERADCAQLMNNVLASPEIASYAITGIPGTGRDVLSITRRSSASS